MNDNFHFVDVQGYGYAKVSKREREKCVKIMEEYFTKRSSLKLAVLIVDIRHKPTNDDVMMYDFLKYYNMTVLVIATKLDKIPKNKKQQHLQQVINTLEMEKEDTIIPFSSETGEGKDAAWNFLQQYL